MIRVKKKHKAGSPIILLKTAFPQYGSLVKL